MMSRPPKKSREWTVGSIVLWSVYGAVIGLCTGLGATILLAGWVESWPHKPPRADVDWPGDWSGLVVVILGLYFVVGGTVLGLLFGLILAIRAARRERRSRASEPLP